jgi:hypothetical protein
LGTHVDLVLLHAAVRVDDLRIDDDAAGWEPALERDGTSNADLEG